MPSSHSLLTSKSFRPAGEHVSGFLDEAVGAYIDRLAPTGGPELEALEARGHGEGYPIVGHAEGALLYVLARAVRPTRILELGTAIGYSGTWLARALEPEGELITVEANPETAEIARQQFRRMGVSRQVRVLGGLAEEVVQEVPGPFDVIFNDIDKTGYPKVLGPCIGKLRLGGLLLTDNVLRHGDAARESKDPSTKAIQVYNERLAADPRMVTVILPLRDGVSVSLKVSE